MRLVNRQNIFPAIGLILVTGFIIWFWFYLYQEAYLNTPVRSLVVEDRDGNVVIDEAVIFYRANTKYDGTRMLWYRTINGESFTYELKGGEHWTDEIISNVRHYQEYFWETDVGE